MRSSFHWTRKPQNGDIASHILQSPAQPVLWLRICFAGITYQQWIEQMTDPTMTLMEFLRNVGLEPDEGVLQGGLRQLSQVVMELEAAEPIGVGRNNRTPECKT